MLYVAVAVTAAITFTDWPIGATSDFWVDHPMFGAIVSGIVLLGVAVMGVDEWLRRREVAHWQIVAKVAFQDLAQEMLMSARALARLTDIDRFTDRAAQGLDPTFGTRVSAYFDSHPAEGDLAARVEALADRPDWIAFAATGLQATKDSLRQAVARWAAVMLTTTDLAAVLDHIANLATRLSDIHMPVYYARGGAAMPSGWQRKLATDWKALSRDLVAYQHLLRVEGGLPAYRENPETWLDDRRPSETAATQA